MDGCIGPIFPYILGRVVAVFQMWEAGGARFSRGLGMAWGKVFPIFVGVFPRVIAPAIFGVGVKMVPESGARVEPN